MKTALRFFFSNAGYSYDPARQTKLQGRWETARTLAGAEAAGDRLGLQFEWEVDDSTNRDFTDEGPEYWLWHCACRSAEGDLLACLGGVDFGPHGHPVDDPYSRVVQAELACEALASISKRMQA